MVYVVAFLIDGLIWGLITKTINNNKGYEGGFWWGFFLSIIGVIVVACKTNLNYLPQRNGYNPPAPSNSSYAGGGWKCPNCSMVNPSYFKTCECGFSKPSTAVSTNTSSTGTTNTLTSVRSIPENASRTDTTKIENKELEIIKKYKELLDIGAITQEEFDKKKREYLYPEETIENSTPSNKADSNQDSLNWKCENCGKENTLDRKSCKFCGAIRLNPGH